MKPTRQAGSGSWWSKGIEPERIVLDATSRNTDENAVNSRELLAAADAPILLVTSAFHMPRSVGLYRAQGFDVVPWPVDYRSSGTRVCGSRSSSRWPISTFYHRHAGVDRACGLCGDLADRHAAPCAAMKKAVPEDCLSTGLLAVGSSAAAEETHHERDDQERQEQEEQDLRDASGCAGDAAEAEDASDQGDHQKTSA